MNWEAIGAIGEIFVGQNLNVHCLEHRLAVVGMRQG